MKFHSRLIGRSTKIELSQDAPGQPPAVILLLDVEIDCEQCGQHHVRFAGHHLRALRNLLVETIDRDPELCGDEAGIEVAQRLQFGGAVPKDPSAN